MENALLPKVPPLRMAGIIAMFFGVQALFVVGCYLFRYSPHSYPGLSHYQYLRLTIGLVGAANLLVFVGGAARLHYNRRAA